MHNQIKIHKLAIQVGLVGFMLGTVMSVALGISLILAFVRTNTASGPPTSEVPKVNEKSIVKASQVLERKQRLKTEVDPAGATVGKTDPFEL
jgi:hypothetical protein